MTTSASFSIPADHPALAGHFPGDPLVPGSMVLECVVLASPIPVRGIDFVKFRRPVLPATRVDLEFIPAGKSDSIAFECRSAGDLLCSGRLRTRPST